MIVNTANEGGRAKTVLTIAGSDPSGGAGIQADLRTIDTHRLAGLAVVSAITAQNTRGVDAVYPVEPEQLRAQLQTLLADIRPDAVKIGMLGTAAQVEIVAEIVAEHSLDSVVLDPVLASTAGVPLLDRAGIDVLLRRLIPLATLVTPNWTEAQTLADVAIDDSASPVEAAARLAALGAQAVLIKGGHRIGEPIDTLVTQSDTVEYRGERIGTPHTHGTGCFLSTAIACNLALGLSLIDAVAIAKESLSRALRSPVTPGDGRGYPTIPSPSSVRKSATRDLRGLYVLTDPVLRPDRSPVDVVRAALEGGARIIQMRDKLGSTPELIDLARRLGDLCRTAGALFIVNDRVDIALAANADGVHLGPDDMAPADVRQIAGNALLIGVSVSTVEEAAAAAPYADYFGVGAVYGSSTKLDAGAAIGTERLREIKAAFPYKPIVAIGGIGESNIVEVVATGVESAAVISAVVCARDMVRATRNLARVF